MDFLDILREKAFLGREFLTWLWFKSEQSGGRIEIRGNRVMEVLFLDRMTLDLAETETAQVVSVRGGQSELREGMAALREGKKIEEARISVRSTDNDFTMVLKATWFSFGSFRTPAILSPEGEDSDEGAEATFLEKISLVEEAMDNVDALFEHFIRLRISDQWETVELLAIRKWIGRSIS